MRRPANRGHRAHGCRGTRDHMLNGQSPGCIARGTGRGGSWRRPPTAIRGRARTFTSPCGHKTGASGNSLRRRSSWRQSSTKWHRRQTRDCKRRSTTTTSSASPPPRRPAGTGPPPGGRQPNPRCGKRRKTVSPLALRRILPPRPTRRIFAALMPPWDQWQPPTKPLRRTVMQEDSQWR